MAGLLQTGSTVLSWSGRVMGTKARPSRWLFSVAEDGLHVAKCQPRDVCEVRLGLGPPRRTFIPLSFSASLVSLGLRMPGPEGHIPTLSVWSKRHMAASVVCRVNKNLSLSPFTPLPPFFFSFHRQQLRSEVSACHGCWALCEVPLHD